LHKKPQPTKAEKEIGNSENVYATAVNFPPFFFLSEPMGSDTKMETHKIEKKNGGEGTYFFFFQRTACGLIRW